MRVPGCWLLGGMIAIKVAGKYLDLPRDARIRVKMPSQLFAFDFVSNGYSYPIALPYTPTNQKLMRFYDRLASTAEFDDIPCTIELGGAHWRPAMIKYRGFKNGAYDVDLQVPDDQAVIDMRGMRTTDLAVQYDLSIDWMTAGLGDMNNIFESRLDDADNTDFIFAPYRNTGIFGDRVEHYYFLDPSTATEYSPLDEYVNYYDADRDQPWLRYTVAGGDPNRWVHEFTPLPYLCKVMEHVLDLVGLRLAGDVFRNEEVRTQVVLNNYLIHGQVGEDGIIAIAASDIGDPVYPTAYLKHMLPDIPVVDLLLRVCRRYNAVPLFRDGRVLEIRSRVDVLNSSVYEDITRFAEPSRDMEMEESDGLALSELEEGTDDARLDEKYDPARIIGTVLLPTDLGGLIPSNADLGVVKVENKVYKYQNGAWDILADYLPPVSVGDEPSSQDVGVGFVSMFRGEDASKPGREWLLPQVEQVMSDPTVDVHRLGPNPIEQLRLLFYRGLQDDSANDPYPLLSNDVYDYGGNVITGATMREALDGDAGIYARWYEPWVRATQKARVAPRRVRLPLHRLRNFRWDRKLMIDGNLFLCREIDVEFTTTGMGIPVLDLLRLPTRITGVRLPISCAGRGHSTIVIGGGSITVKWRSTTGYLSYRMEDGIITTVGAGTPSTEYTTVITVADATATPVCMFSSNAAGESNGDVTTLLVQISGGEYMASLTTNYLQALEELTAGAGFIEEPLDLTQNAQLITLDVSSYALPTLDVSGCPLLGSITAPGSFITSLDVTGLTNLSLLYFAGGAIADTDSIFIALYNMGITAGTFDFSGGTNAAPTGASLVARTWLAANGNTLNHN